MTTKVNNEKVTEARLHTEMKFNMLKCLFLFLISFIWVRKVITQYKMGENELGFYNPKHRVICTRYRKEDPGYGWTILHERVHAGQHMLSCLGLHRQFKHRHDSLNMLYIELEADYLNTVIRTYGDKDKGEVDSIIYRCVSKAEDYQHKACGYQDMDIKPSEVCKAYFPKTYSKSTELRQKLREEDDNFKSIVSNPNLLYIARLLRGIL